MLPRYGRLGASSRLRLYQYLPWLNAARLRVDAAPLFGDGYVRALQQGRRPALEVLRAWTGRLSALLRQGAYDLVWLEKDALPWLPAALEQRLLGGRTPYVLDYDDAVFHGYDQHPRALVRRLLGDKHPRLMRGAAMVLCGNDYLADFARRAGAQRVELLPTAVDLRRYAPGDAPGDEPRDVPGEGAAPAAGDVRGDSPPRVGWIGQRATAAYLLPCKALFERLQRQERARFVAVGVDAAALGLPMESVAWSEQTEVRSIAGFDVGIMPLADGPFERGKCGYKLIQYMACGLPVVASPVGVNRAIVEHGVNGFLAETPQQWEQALQALLGDAALRRRMGQAGRRKVERHYSVQVTGPRLAALLGEAAGAATAATATAPAA